MRRHCVLGLMASVLFMGSPAVFAQDCNAKCPSRPIGLADLRERAPLIVSPSKIPPGFTGCQIAWDADSNKRMVLTFRDGKIVKHEGMIFGKSPGTFRCLYENDALASGSDAMCANFGVEGMRRGIFNTEPEEAQLDWPAGQCVPVVKAKAPQKVAAPNPASEKLFNAVDDLLDDSRSVPKDAQALVDRALVDLERAITSSPNDALLQLAMGRALIIHDCGLNANNCSIRAKGHLTRSIELDPKLVRAHVLLAHDAMNAGCLPCSKTHMYSAFKADLGSPYVSELRGRYAQLSGQQGEAEKFYLDAIKAFPTPKKRWNTYTWLSQVYQEREDHERTEWALQMALEAAPDGAWSNGNLGTYYIFARGDYEKAIPVLRRTLSIMSYGMAREGLALALYERWADAYLKKAHAKLLKTYWDDAQAESSDAQSMFFISASYAGTGRAARALLASRKVPDSVLDQAWDRGRTPLLMAAYNNNTDLTVYLIERGANPNARDSLGFYVAHVAGASANFRVLDALARKNANLQVLTQEQRETVLMQVTRTGKRKPDKLKSLALLLDNGVPIEAKSTNGATALSYAIGARDVDMVRYLLNRGAQTNGDIFNGMTPAAYAAVEGDLEILQELAKNNANLDAMVSGLSLADLAEKYGQPEVAKWLRSRKPGPK
ncbi:MAG: ankyrin repeat domain-containing protein [Methyloceanibacter sp.]